MAAARPQLGADMNGQRVPVGKRKTYFPPFVNERFDGPPWWACTFTALLNGANVGFLGLKPATHREVRALAVASGDVELAGGSRSSHMIRAMRVRYGKRMAMERLTPQRAQERLASGWALVAAVTYGDLPKHFRRWSPTFKKGHRITLLGWDGKSTTILDPLARKGPEYTGELIPWRDLEPAWWASEQLWFAEGMFRPGPSVRLVEKMPNGLWRAPAGCTLKARVGDKPQVYGRNLRLKEPKSGHFDAVVELVSPGGTRIGEFLRVSSGGLNGMLLPAATKGLTFGRKTGAPLKAAVKPAPTEPAQPKVNGNVAAAATPADIPSDPEAAYRKGREDEWNRIHESVVVNLPPAP